MTPVVEPQTDKDRLLQSAVSELVQQIDALDAVIQRNPPSAIKEVAKQMRASSNRALGRVRQARLIL